MNDMDQWGPIGVVIASFVPMFICASLLRAKGVAGLLAVTGVVVIAVVVVMDFQDWRLAVGGISALLGLALGGKLSDHREYQRKQRASEAERRKRDQEKRI